LTPVSNMSVNSTEFDFGQGEGFHTASSDCCHSWPLRDSAVKATQRSSSYHHIHRHIDPFQWRSWPWV